MIYRGVISLGKLSSESDEREGARRATGRSSLSDTIGRMSGPGLTTRFDYMQRYSKEFKDSLISRMLSPSNTPVAQLALETGVPRDTLYCWRLAAMRGGVRNNNPHDPSAKALTGEGKLTVILETATFNEHELSEYCRQNGLYPEEVKGWRKNCIQANQPYCPRAERKQAREQAGIIKELQAELHRKDKALAETATLLVLQKKTQALWAVPGDAKLNSRSGSK